MSAPGRSPADRARFAPLVFRLAARLDQLTWSEFTGDPAAMAQALRVAQATFSSDALVSWFDTWSEAEELGLLAGRHDDGQPIATGAALDDGVPVVERLTTELLPRLVAMTARLNAERDSATVLVAAVTGPFTLRQRLWPQAADADALAQAGQWCVAQARAHFEAGADLVIVAEENIDGLGPAVPLWGRALAPVLKVARYYHRVALVLAPDSLPPEAVEWARAAGLDVVGQPVRLVVGGARSTDRWLVIPNGLLAADELQWQQGLDELRGDDSRPFVLSSWEIPTDTEPERLAALAEAVRSIATVEG